MMDFLYKLFLSINSISIFFYLYILHTSNFLIKHNLVLSAVLYLGLILLLNFISLIIFRFLSSPPGQIEAEEINNCNDSFVPSYIGYFFISLSIPKDNYPLLFIAFFIILVLVFCSQGIVFNPIFLLFKYKFYRIKTKDGHELCIITKLNLWNIQDCKFSGKDLRQLNRYTYVYLNNKE